MKHNLEEMRRSYAEGLGSAAYEYLMAGLDMFHRHRNSEATPDSGRTLRALRTEYIVTSSTG